MEIITKSPIETQKLGRETANKLKSGQVFAFYGNLGAGKTTFLQGFAEGLGVKGRIISPTFIIVRTYDANHGKIKHFYHVDLYRLDEKYMEPELENLGITDVWEQEDTVVAIEWADKARGLLPVNLQSVYINGEGEERKIRIE